MSIKLVQHRHFINEVHVSRQGSVRPCICMLGYRFWLFYNFSIGFWNCLGIYFCFSFYF